MDRGAWGATVTGFRGSDTTERPRDDRVRLTVSEALRLSWFLLLLLLTAEPKPSCSSPGDWWRSVPQMSYHILSTDVSGTCGIPQAFDG